MDNSTLAKESFENIRRTAERGIVSAIDNNDDKYVDIFQHIIDEWQVVKRTSTDFNHNDY